MQSLKIFLIQLVCVFSATVILSACGGSSSSNTTTATEPTDWYNHIAIFRNSTTWVMGNNASGQVGVSGNPITTPRLLGNYSGVSVGSNHTLAFRKYSTIRAWGSNWYGQLGNGTTSNSTTSPVAVHIRNGSSLSGIIAVSAGGNHSLALDKDQNVWSWGSNTRSQLGRSSRFKNISSLSAYTVDMAPYSASGKIQAISAGGEHSMALANEGIVLAWGLNARGQIGNGSPDLFVSLPSEVLFPVPVPASVAMAQISAGGSHSLALDSNKNVWAWGYNYYGQLGDTTNTDRKTPVKVRTIDSTSPTVTYKDLSNIDLIAAGSDHSLAYSKGDHKLYVWGYNGYGQLCIPYNRVNYATEIPNFDLTLLTGNYPEVILAVGQHSHARKTDGTWWSWGDNTFGQLGVVPTDPSKPTQIPSLSFPH